MNQWGGEEGGLMRWEEEGLVVGRGLVALVGWVGVSWRFATVARRRAEVVAVGDMVAEVASASVLLDMLKDWGLEGVGCWFEG